MTKANHRNEVPRSERDTIPAPPPAHLIESSRPPGRRPKRHGTTEESGLLKIIKEVLKTVA